MYNKNNIIKLFVRNLVLTIAILAIVSTSLIYYIQEKKFEKGIVDDITNHIIIDNAKLTDKQFIKHLKGIDFVTFDLYDENQNKVYCYENGTDIDSLKKEIIDLQGDIKSGIKDVSYKYYKITDNHIYISIFYPLYKNNKSFGYINGVAKVDNTVVKNFEEDTLYTFSIILITVLVVGLVLLPLIFFAYKKMKYNEKELIKSSLLSIKTLGNTIALKDSDTDEHNFRVSIYSVRLAEELQLSRNEIQKTIIGAFLHDVGKIGIKDAILLKNGKLTNDEFEKMKEHVNKGIEIIKGNPWLEQGKDLILCHHEKYDGSGYPNHLKKDDIPQIARMFAIIDVFDALTSKRPYKEPFSYDRAIEILKESSGTHFDPKILEHFLNISKDVYDFMNKKTYEQLRDELSKLTIEYFVDN